MAHRAAALLAALLAVAVAATVLTSCGDDGEEGPFGEERRIEATAATGLATTADGHLVIGELASGRLQELDLTVEGAEPVELRSVPLVDADLEQGGLLGLVALDDTRLAAAVTGTDGRLRIDELDAATGEVRRTRWRGPEAAERANGGRMAVLADGTLLIGIGDLLDPDLVEDPGAPNGKVLAIAEDGTATPWAAGFNNPFALTGDGLGDVWVADNAPGSRPERLLRVTEGDVRRVTEWDDTRVPSGIAVLPDGRLALCSYATGELAIVDPADPGDGRGEVIADDCRYGVVALGDGGLAYAAPDEVVLLEGAGIVDDD